MTLFHFTWIAHLPAMLGMTLADGTVAKGERGITPTLKDSGIMTAGRPVVWLTSRDSLMPTADDLAWVPLARARGLFTKEEAEHLVKYGTCGDRTLRLTVDLSNSRRLRHFGTLVDEAIKHCMSPSALTDWWIYFGTIQPDRITNIERTDAPYCSDGERTLWKALEKSFTAVCEEVD